MRKLTKIFVLLLSLTLALSFAGAAAVSADGAPDGSCAMVWEVLAKDAEGNDLQLSTPEDVADSLGAGFALGGGMSAAEASTVSDLRESGVKITPPAGYRVASVMIVAEGGSPDEGSTSLLPLAKAFVDGSAAAELGAPIFAEDFYDASVGSVFNGSGDTYVLRIALERIEPGSSITLSYSAGAMASVLGDAELFPGGNAVTLWFDEGGSSASGSFAALGESVARSALMDYGKQFTGWKLTLSGGATASVQGGEGFTLSSSATLEAQWRDVIVFSFTGGEKLYDGEPLLASYTQGGQLREGDTLQIPDDAFTLSRVEAGESDATLDLERVHILRGDEDVTDEYEFLLIPAKLRVISRGVTFRVTDAQKEYDGTALLPSEYTVDSGALVEGHTVSVSYSGRQTVPGSSDASATFTISDAEGHDVSSNYNISVINGSLTVLDRSEKQPLTVTITNAEKEYDGTADLPAVSYSVTAGSLLGSDSLSGGELTGSITGVGTGSINGSFAVLNGDTDVSDQYEITVVPGRLTVKARALVLTADSAEKEFDGKPLKKNSFTITSGTLVEGHKLTATVTGSRTKVGSSPNKIDPASVKVMSGETDLTAQYSIRLVDGTLTVTGASAPTAITITMKSAEKVYDGKPLSSKDYEITSGALESGDQLVLGEVTGEQTDAGESSVTATFTVKRGKVDVTASYTLTVVSGKLTVKPREITLTAASASKTYDGRPLTSDSFKITSGELVKGHQLSASVSGSQTQPGSSANVVVKSSIKITDSTGKDVAKNYSVTTAAGTLTVNSDPITPITLTVGDSSKVYDGKPYRFLSADVKVSSGVLPSGYRIEATFNPEAPVDAGKYDVTIKNVTIRDASGADVTSRFNITRAKGTLTISQRPLVIETKAANKVYDGTPLTERSTPNITGRVEGHQVTLRITGSQTKVGSSENTVSDVKITDKESGLDVTKNYAISYQYGMLTVTAAPDGSGTSTTYTWVSGSAGTLFVKFDHAYDGFEGLQVDGKDLDRANYTSASGSTEVWLKAAYLNTLSPGTHTLKAKYAGGETVQTTFEVKGSQGTRTGDSNHLGLWIAILAAALAAVFAAAWYLFLGKDRRWKKRPVKKSK